MKTGQMDHESRNSLYTREGRVRRGGRGERKEATKPSFVSDCLMFTSKAQRLLLTKVIIDKGYH